LFPPDAKKTVQEITERAQNNLITYQYPQPINTPEAQMGVAEIYEDFVAIGKGKLSWYRVFRCGK